MVLMKVTINNKVRAVTHIFVLEPAKKNILD